ncbi:FG-GAP-like repeat-containing protein [Streptomyces roseolus]|uniref:FG-GAP-like repeat-containing protein n=1 Tax=Streptomyces roseolus TaxID=67358 RepID=UPI0016791696|nr:FG-GAP-like repeat-containing protein [Streptomyces roseolus]GGR36162.1 hypothetical protein GCM10010282_30740 [Streptomyces roseolus]
MRPSPSARLLRGALALSAALGLSATALSAPAAAATGADRCPDGRLCVFSEPGHRGEMLVVTGPMLSLGSWDNRIRPFVFEPDHLKPLPGVCLHPEPGLAPEGTGNLYGSTSFHEGEYRNLDLAVSSVDVGQEAASSSCGREDLYARDRSGVLWLYPGNGRGAFHPRKLIGTGGWNAHKELLGLGDVTGDGRPDVVAHTAAPNDWGHPWLKVYPGTGDGNLRAPVRFAELRPSTYAF